MTDFRCFLNVDPPAIAKIWRSQPPLRGLIHDVTPDLLEKFVFSKPYFDRSGLILALQDDVPVGFVHAGFGPSADLGSLSKDTGVICLLMAAPSDDQRTIMDELLKQSESFLFDQGAQKIYAMGQASHSPFYCGLYGGSAVSGVLQSDEIRLAIFQAANYEPTGCSLVLQRTLEDFRPPVDRKLVRLRRTNQIVGPIDPEAQQWWEACTLGGAERTRFNVNARDSGQQIGQATFWTMELMAAHWNKSAVGLTEIEIVESMRGQGFGTFLLGESLRHLQSSGATLVEVHVPQQNTAASALFKKLGFTEVDRATEMCKSVMTND